VILGLLFLLAFVAYILRLNLSVAGKFMMDDLGLTQIQLGWALSAFVWGYTIFQFPGGIFGGWLGPRRALTLVVVAWGVITVFTGLLPGVIFAATTASLFVLISLRFLQGVFQGPYFPTQAGAIEAWFPPAGWAFPNSLVSTGLGLGAAATPPLIAWLMVTIGWRESFYVTAPLALLAAAVWWRIARDTPAEHPGVGEAELELIRGDRMPPDSGGHARDGWKRLLTNRDTVLLAASYMLMNYVFYIFFSWFFIYLVDVRGFSILGGGVLAATPFVVGALSAAVGGFVCDRLCRRIGPRWGCRWTAIGGLAVAALLLFAGATAPNPYLAVLFLSLCFGGTQFTEGAYWSAQTYVAGPDTAPATGILNTGGNLAGAIATPLVPILAAHFGWIAALASGSVFAVLAAALWLLIRADRPA
jgi:ACS family glucarate transporter-like MFS transporter